MFEELEQYLLTVVSPERTQVLIDACEAIYLAGISGHTNDIDILLSECENKSNDQTLCELESLLVTVVEACLNQFGCFLSDEAELKYASTALRGLLDLTNYNAPAVIEGICQSGIPPEEALGELLELVTEFNSDDYLLTFERVSAVLLTRVVESLTPESASMESLVESFARPRAVTYLQKYPDLLVVEAVSAGMAIGSELTVLLTPYLEQFDRLTPERGAIELLGIVLVSGTAHDAVRDVSLDALEDVFPDINRLTKAAGALTKLLTQVSYE